jgi:hypothetical protein
VDESGARHLCRFGDEVWRRFNELEISGRSGVEAA